jgi:hypothetical protein
MSWNLLFIKTTRFKIPRREPRSRVDVYLGFSPHRASSVLLVLSTTTELFSPNFTLSLTKIFQQPNHFTPTMFQQIGQLSLARLLYPTSMKISTKPTFMILPGMTIHPPLPIRHKSIPVHLKPLNLLFIRGSIPTHLHHHLGGSILLHPHNHLKGVHLYHYQLPILPVYIQVGIIIISATPFST